MAPIPSATIYHAILFFLMMGCTVMSSWILVYFWGLKNGIRFGLVLTFLGVAAISGYRAWDLANIVTYGVGRIGEFDRWPVLVSYSIIDAGLYVTLRSLLKRKAKLHE